MYFPGQGYTTGGYYPSSGGYPHPQQQYPPPNGYYPPPSYYPQPQSYPPPNQGYAPPNQGYAPPNQGYAPPNQNYPSHPPPPIPPRFDPTFSPNDPTVAQANYPQPPHSTYNQSPNPVPYIPNNVNMNDFILHVDPKYRNAPPPQFQLSNCQGRKRALLIGINYFGTSAELRGCINDVHNMKNFLITLYNFREEDMVILTDDQTNPKNIPTKQNIITAMQWLVHDSRPNDSFFFHFSGHGGRMKDYDGDEDDGYDETIYPVDHAIYGQIVDDMMNDIMVKPLATGCRLTAIFDSCHSGTALDLPYVYSTHGAIKESSFFKDAGSNLKNAGLAYLSGDPSRAISSVMSLGSRLLSGSQSQAQKERIKQLKGSPADVVMFSGCKDDQTSADATEAGRATGAMSYAITTSLRQNRNQSYIQLLNSIRHILRQKYQQRPQLSSSHPMDMNLLFII
ncbi:caspase domain-containing protein [Cokeromyces recurvatus]|uniref:caspase domain-containing protein n=1 Tax=Cokeromyces recurvatus TaxID=90255 RepID=UPI00221FD782|nr:caspase domain-containing protein [Cokeromyces recurvatus]KAI7897524.1 caspase domain-containing protein [Cokeromyces recurvatus]